jgi:hypothetical protein
MHLNHHTTYHTTPRVSGTVLSEFWSNIQKMTLSISKGQDHSIGGGFSGVLVMPA